MGVTLYKPHSVDVDNPENNGGAISDEVIESGVLEALLPNLRFYDVDTGVDRYVKFFIKSDVDIRNVLIYLTPSNFYSYERYFIAKGGASEFESELDKSGFKESAFKVVSVDTQNNSVTFDKNINGSMQVGDIVYFYGGVDDIFCEVAYVDRREVGFTAIAGDITGAYALTPLFFKENKAGESVSVWVRDVVDAGKLPQESPITSQCFVMYETN